MHSDNAIQVENLSKIYKLFTKRRDHMKELLHPFGKKYHQPHTALEGVSFSIRKGEVVGVIGENGSGKSTLLKILTKVVTPTSGKVICNGKLTALLELGAGFNRDLSGVENIFYLGAIQGYSRKEMDERLPAILEFADIGEYVWQPVKNYSSGMYVRLAFSFSININPEILIIDEALSVGDIRFQQKCYRKIRSFKEEGKTILICTHSMSVVKDFCNRAIWLHKGRIREEGDPGFVTEAFHAFMTSRETVTTRQTNNDNQHEVNHDILSGKEFQNIRWTQASRMEHYHNGCLTITHAAFVSKDNNENIRRLQGGEEVRLLLRLVSTKALKNVSPGLVLNGPLGTTIFELFGADYEQVCRLEADEAAVVGLDFEFPHLANGVYTLTVKAETKYTGENAAFTAHDVFILEVNNESMRYRNHSGLVITAAQLIYADNL